MGLTAEIVAFVLATAVLGDRVIRYRAIRLDPTFLFTLGHLYYMSTAALMYRARALREFSNVYLLLDRVPADRRDAFSVWSLAFLVCFLVGARLARMLPHARPRRVRRIANFRAPSIALVAASMVMFLYACVVFRATIIGGYRTTDIVAIQTGAGRGVVSATATATALSVLFLRHQYWLHSPKRHRLVDDLPFVAAISPLLLVLLAAGGRLYATTFIVAGAAWWSIVTPGVRRNLLIVGGAGGVLFLSAFGAIRTAQVPAPRDLAVYATAESVLVSISPSFYLDSSDESLEAIRAPVYLSTDFINAVPRFILPNKNDLQRTPEDDGFEVTSSLGGVSVGSSMLVNFGWLGSLMVTALGGFALMRLWMRAVDNPAGLLSVGLSVVVAALPMSLYRDTFAVSIVRWMFLTGLIQTVICYVLLRLGARPEDRRANWTATKTPSWVASQHSEHATAP